MSFQCHKILLFQTLLYLSRALKNMKASKYSTEKTRFSLAIEMWDKVYSSGKSVTPSGCCLYIYLFYFQFNFVSLYLRTAEGDENVRVLATFREEFLSSDVGFLGRGNNLTATPKIKRVAGGRETVLGISCPIILHFI